MLVPRVADKFLGANLVTLVTVARNRTAFETRGSDKQYYCVVCIALSDSGYADWVHVFHLKFQTSIPRNDYC